MAKFADFLNRVLFEDEKKEEISPEGETPIKEFSEEEIEDFETAVSSNTEDNINEMAKKIIMDSQYESDNDEFPDISRVQEALDTAGSDANHDLICRMLTNLLKCNPEDLKKDGELRKTAILNAINATKQRDTALKEEKAKSEEALVLAEKTAEADCTQAISLANSDSEKAIEEEKARSAAIIAAIRKETDEATERAKLQRDQILESIAIERAENEAVLLKSANLTTETENQGQVVIKQIDEWLKYLN